VFLVECVVADKVSEPVKLVSYTGQTGVVCAGSLVGHTVV
jgi:hypothetical protein